MFDFVADYRKTPALLCREWGVREFAVFGSAFRGDMSSNSDVDVLISFEENTHRDLFDLAAMRDELQEIFGRDVDLIEKEAMKNPIRRKAILENCRVIYAA